MSLASPVMLRAAVALTVAALVWSGIAPYDRTTWWLEVMPVLIALPVLYLTRRRYPLTPLLYVLLFLHGLVLIGGGLALLSLFGWLASRRSGAGG